jgi:thiamine transport system substrate-binding protein
MIRLFLGGFAFVFLLNFAFAQSQPLPQPPELVIYTYDSFVAPEGLGPAIFPIFEKQNRCRVRALASGDGAQILTRLELDARRGKPTAQLVVGIDQPLWERAKPWLESWGNWSPNGYSRLSSELKIEQGFLPYDYGVLALMADQDVLRELGLKAPVSLSDLLNSEWKRNIILQDPRTSTPGLAFLLFTRSVFGNSVWDFWKKFRSQWLTLTPGWDKSYGLFLKKEAPLVWSYLTSQAYHEEHGDKNDSKRRYSAVIFQEGQPVQIEGAAWVKGGIRSSQERDLAKKFLEFLITPEVQKLIPQKTWMMPVQKNVVLPKSFKNLPKPVKWISTFAQSKDIEESLSQWSRIVGR